jgi:hypothetical protein
MFYANRTEKLCNDLSIIVFCQIVPLGKAMSKQTFSAAFICNMWKEGKLEYSFKNWQYNLRSSQWHKFTIKALLFDTQYFCVVDSDKGLNINNTQTMHGGVSTAKWLSEHATMLHYAYIAYLVNWYFISPHWKFLYLTSFKFRNC